MIKATTSMQQAVKTLPSERRRDAQRLAERIYVSYRATLERFAQEDNLTDDDIHYISGEAAAAEVLYRFS